MQRVKTYLPRTIFFLAIFTNALIQFERKKNFFHHLNSQDLNELCPDVACLLPYHLPYRVNPKAKQIKVIYLHVNQMDIHCVVLVFFACFAVSFITFIFLVALKMLWLLECRNRNHSVLNEMEPSNISLWLGWLLSCILIFLCM